MPLSTDDVSRLKSQQWHLDDSMRGQRVMVRQGALFGGYRLAHRSDGSCVFLQHDGLCAIHCKFGLEAKPTICQTFPFQLIPQDKQATLTVRRACPSAGRDLGRPTTEHLAFIERQVRERRLKAEPIAAPHIKPGEQRDWTTTRGLLNLASRLLCDPRYPPVRRLVHVLQFAGHLESANTRRLNNSQVIELGQTLAELAPDEAKPFFEDRQLPRAYSRIMFRFLAVDCARLHPDCRHKSRWSTRIELTRTALKTVRGVGQAPLIDKIFPQVNLEELEKPCGAMRPQVYVPLTRLLETTSESFMYALADRPGWSVIDSLRALALLFPVGLYLLKWLSAGREPTVEDMVKIVVALDRTQGYAPLCGALHRWRVSALATNHELERLVVWAAR